MDTYNSMEAYQQTKDFEQFLLIKSMIEKEFQNGIRTDLLKNLENVYVTKSNFAKSGELMKVLLQGREMSKNGQKKNFILAKSGELMKILSQGIKMLKNGQKKKYEKVSL